MAKFKALESPDQAFSIGSSTYRFYDGIYETENKEIIAFLKQNPFCKLVPEQKAEKEPSPEVIPPAN